MPDILAGRSETGHPVVTGEFILWFYDTRGIAIDVTVELLRDRGWGFDVLGLVRACLDNPNFSADRTLRLLKESGLEEWRAKQCIAHVITEVRET